MTARADFAVRVADAADVAALAGIERAAAAQFREVGIDGTFLDEVTPQAELERAQREGRLWVATADGACVGFAVASRLDRVEAWLDEVDVLPAYGRRGIGRALVEEAIGWAAAAGLCCIGLATFAEVPWNAPFYRRQGFRVLRGGEISAAEQRILDEEKARGLPAEARVAMRLDLTNRPRPRSDATSD